MTQKPAVACTVKLVFNRSRRLRMSFYWGQSIFSLFKQSKIWLSDILSHKRGVSLLFPGFCFVFEYFLGQSFLQNNIWMVQPVYLFIPTSMTSIPGTQKAGTMKAQTLCYDMSPDKSYLKDEWRTDPQCNFGCNNTKLLHNKKNWVLRILLLFHWNKKYVRWIKAWEASVYVCVRVLKWCPGILAYELNKSCSCLNVLCEHPHIFTRTLCWKVAASQKNIVYTLKQPNNAVLLKWFTVSYFVAQKLRNCAISSRFPKQYYVCTHEVRLWDKCSVKILFLSLKYI